MPERREQTVVAQPLRCQTWRAGVRAACCRPSAIRASPGVSFRKATVHRAPRQLVSGSCQPRVKPRLTPGFSRPAVCSRTLRPQQRQDQTRAWPAQAGQDRQDALTKTSHRAIMVSTLDTPIRGAGIGGSSTSVGISPSQGLSDQHAPRRKSPRRRLLPSRRCETCSYHPSAQASSNHGQVKNLPPQETVTPACNR